MFDVVVETGFERRDMFIHFTSLDKKKKMINVFGNSPKLSFQTLVYKHWALVLMPVVKYCFYYRHEKKMEVPKR